MIEDASDGFQRGSVKLDCVRLVVEWCLYNHDQSVCMRGLVVPWKLKNPSQVNCS